MECAVTDSSSSPVHGDRALTLAQAAQDWHLHQPDRTWFEFAVRWPLVTIARPRCLAGGCRRPWPCPPALAADAWLTQYEAAQAGAAGA
jgi:hypothetical protein